MSNVEVFTDKSGRSKGTAMVQFEDPGSAHDAIGILLCVCVVCVCMRCDNVHLCVSMFHAYVRTYVCDP